MIVMRLRHLVIISFYMLDETQMGSRKGQFTSTMVNYIIIILKRPNGLAIRRPFCLGKYYRRSLLKKAKKNLCELMISSAKVHI